MSRVIFEGEKHAYEAHLLPCIRPCFRMAQRSDWSFVCVRNYESSRMPPRVIRLKFRKQLNHVHPTLRIYLKSCVFFYPALGICSMLFLKKLYYYHSAAEAFIVASITMGEYFLRKFVSIFHWCGWLTIHTLPVEGPLKKSAIQAILSSHHTSVLHRRLCYSYVFCHPRAQSLAPSGGHRPFTRSRLHWFGFTSYHCYHHESRYIN